MHTPLLFVFECVSQECVDCMRSISEFICQSCESVSEIPQLWDPIEHWVPCSVRKYYNVLHLAYILFSCHTISGLADCAVIWWNHSQPERKALLVRKVNACNPVKRNITVGKEREVFSLGSCWDCHLLLDAQQKSGQEPIYFVLLDSLLVQT